MGFKQSLSAKEKAQHLDLVIPSEAWGQPVTAIGAKAFENSELASVKIPSSVTIIGERAFAENKLNNLIIPNSVKTIGYEAFNKTTKVTIGANVRIDRKAFYSGIDNKDIFDKDFTFEMAYESNKNRAGTYIYNYNVGWGEKEAVLAAVEEFESKLESETNYSNYNNKNNRSNRSNNRSTMIFGGGFMGNAYLLDQKIYEDENTEKSDRKSDGGPSIGLITGISFTDQMALYLELYYTYRVFQNKNCSENCTRIEEHLFNIPLLIKRNFSQDNMFYIEGGVMFGIPLVSTVYTHSTNIDRERDFGYILGVGITGSNAFDFGVRFGVNTSDYTKNSNGSLWFFGLLIRIGRL